MNIVTPRTVEWTYDIKQDTFSWSEDLSLIIDLGEVVDRLSLQRYRQYIHEDDRGRFMEAWRSSIGDGGLLDVEYRLIDANGLERWVLQMGVVSNGRKGVPPKVRGILKDITDLKNAAMQLSESSRRESELEDDLSSARNDLQEFTYHASHDLNAPLRSVVGFSQIVLEDYSDKLDDRAKDYLSRTVVQARRLEEMLDDLLVLSRIMAHPVNWQNLNLSRIASEIVLTMEKTPGDLFIEEGMTCMGDRDLMETALRCLLDNAIKFSGNKKKAKIEFRKRSVDGEDHYFISDNGIGFDMNYEERLFRPFQRFHTAKQYPGNGMGLAIAATVIHKHCGRIWVESTIDGGTTFYFVIGRPSLMNE